MCTSASLACHNILSTTAKIQWQIVAQPLCGEALTQRPRLFAEASLPMAKMKLVLVEWVDSGGSSGWTELKDVPKSVHPVESVGWLVHDGKDAKTIVSHKGGEDGSHMPEQVYGWMVIPASAIKRIINIYPAGKRSRRLSARR